LTLATLSRAFCNFSQERCRKFGIRGYNKTAKFWGPARWFALMPAVQIGWSNGVEAAYVGYQAFRIG
jgi:hypothetical protein